jgi:hypothetical protein
VGFVLAACGPSSASSISGTVLGAATEGVTVTFSGAGSATATTDATGFYAFTDLSGGTYTVTPSRTGYAFLPASREVSVFGTLIDQVNVVPSAAATDPRGPAEGAIHAPSYRMAPAPEGSHAGMAATSVRWRGAEAEHAGDPVDAGR